MFSGKPILWIFTAILTLSFCSPWAAMAQSGEPRLIPLALDTTTTTIPSQDFVVYGRATKGHPVGTTSEDVDNLEAYTGEGAYEAGIERHVSYQQIPNAKQIREPSKRMPDLETFFEFGGTLELLTLEMDDSPTKLDIVMSEIMWAIDEGFDEAAGSNTAVIDNPDYHPETNNEVPEKISIPVPQLDNQVIQWIELYNTTGADITAELFFLFTPFKSHPDRTTVDLDFDGDETDETYTVLDAVDTLFGGSWELPGKRGDRPDTAFVSAYRIIDYDAVEDGDLEGIPFGSEPESWAATPDRGSRNTALKIIYKDKVVDLLAVGTPGTKHVPDIFTTRLEKIPVPSDTIVINEVRNDTSRDNVDWIELKNVGTDTVQLKDWELSIVTAAGTDTDLVDLPEYELEPGEILLLLNEYPWSTSIIEGVAVEEVDSTEREFAPRYFVYTAVDTDRQLPDTGKFVLLLRSESDQNGKDNAIEDYAGNGFFGDNAEDLSTLFWPRIGQSRPRNVAAFGNNTFASTGEAWARLRYEEDDGHHKSAWEKVEEGEKGGLGYDPGANLSTSPGTPGYENDALKSRDARTVADRELSDGDISISEIMYDPGRSGNLPQWIELYNSSRTEAINLKGWRMEIRNPREETRAPSLIRWTFEDAIILPNQTLLLPSRRGRSHEDLSSNRIYDLYKENREDLGLTDAKKLLLSPTAFHMKLTNGRTLVDAVGNLTTSRPEEKVWDLPAINPERRRSIVRVYDQGTAEDGNSEASWHRFPLKGADETYYGVQTDLSSPGYRKGGPVPVSLSSFRPVRMETGEVLIRWKTESELNNAGFNILRSESRDSDFTVINTEGIIAGHGTSSEMHIYSYTDKTAKPNVIYYYRIEDVSFDGAHQTLTTVRLKGDVSATGKLTTMWGELKLQR